MESNESEESNKQETNETSDEHNYSHPHPIWERFKHMSRNLLSKLKNFFSALTGLIRLEDYEYIPPRDQSRLYIANEVPLELEPVFSYLTRGQNGFVIEDDEGETRSLIINVDFWDYIKVMVLLMSVNTVALFVMLIVRTMYPVYYEDLRKQVVF